VYKIEDIRLQIYRQHLFLKQMTIESNSSPATSVTSHMDYRWRVLL